MSSKNREQIYFSVSASLPIYILVFYFLNYLGVNFINSLILMALFLLIDLVRDKSLFEWNMKNKKVAINGWWK